MMKFEKEILEQAAEAEEKVRAIMQRIDENMQSSQNKNGILKQAKGQYAECININIDRMRELFETDSKSWVQELDLVRQRIQ